MTYQIRNREVGEVLAEVVTLDEAMSIVNNNECDDKKNGNYTPNWYDIYDTVAGEVVS